MSHLERFNDSHSCRVITNRIIALYLYHWPASRKLLAKHLGVAALARVQSGDWEITTLAHIAVTSCQNECE